MDRDVELIAGSPEDCRIIGAYVAAVGITATLITAALVIAPCTTQRIAFKRLLSRSIRSVVAFFLLAFILSTLVTLVCLTFYDHCWFDQNLRDWAFCDVMGVTLGAILIGAHQILNAGTTSYMPSIRWDHMDETAAHRIRRGARIALLILSAAMIYAEYTTRMNYQHGE